MIQGIFTNSAEQIVQYDDRTVFFSRVFTLKREIPRRKSVGESENAVL